MTLNMLFFTITSKKTKMSIEDCLNEERINKLRNEYIEKAIMHRNLF
jgi:uncharacterized protein (TIGR02413 family)